MLTYELGDGGGMESTGCLPCFGLCQLVIKVTLNGKTAEPGGRVVGTREQILKWHFKKLIHQLCPVLVTARGNFRSSFRHAGSLVAATQTLVAAFVGSSS